MRNSKMSVKGKPRNSMTYFGYFDTRSDIYAKEDS